jgi:Ca2+-transporting ATPase
MGRRGTDVAKEAAAVVLQDDRFPTIGAAVEEGRVIYANIRRFVFYLFSCNLAEVGVILFAGLIGLPQPLLPLQILWLNLVTDTFPALSLAMEPGDPAVMRRPPQDPHQAILSARFLRLITRYALLITAVTLATFVWALRGAPDDLPRAVTIAFLTLALAQTFHLGNARGPEPVLEWERITANRWALAAAALTLALQVTALHVPPLAALLGVVPLPARDWAVVLAAAALPALAGQGTSLWRARRRAAGAADA